jgi:hypothetical protein
MNDNERMAAAIRGAWSGFPAAPAEELRSLEWEFGDATAREFVGVPPMDVNIGSAGFLGCTPLLIIPARAAATYLGTYMLSLVEGTSYQEKIGIFHDLLTRAHLLNCLTLPIFWSRVVGTLPPVARQTVKLFCDYLLSRRRLLALSDDQVNFIKQRTADP